MVLVEPRDDSDIYGIMTLKDIARKVIAHRKKLHEAHVYEIMSKPVLSTTSDMPIPFAALILYPFFSEVPARLSQITDSGLER